MPRDPDRKCWVAVDAAAEVYLRMIFWASSGKDPTSSSETKILGSSGEGGANQKAFSFFFSNLFQARNETVSTCTICAMSGSSTPWLSRQV